MDVLYTTMPRNFAIEKMDNGEKNPGESDMARKPHEILR